jgi:hypothetical protein
MLSINAFENPTFWVFTASLAIHTKGYGRVDILSIPATYSAGLLVDFSRFGSEEIKYHDKPTIKSSCKRPLCFTNTLVFHFQRSGVHTISKWRLRQAFKRGSSSQFYAKINLVQANPNVDACLLSEEVFVARIPNAVKIIHKSCIGQSRRSEPPNPLEQLASDPRRRKFPIVHALTSSDESWQFFPSLKLCSHEMNRKVGLAFLKGVFRLMFLS